MWSKKAMTYKAYNSKTAPLYLVDTTMINLPSKQQKML